MTKVLVKRIKKIILYANFSDFIITFASNTMNYE